MTLSWWSVALLIGLLELLPVKPAGAASASLEQRVYDILVAHYVRPERLSPSLAATPATPLADRLRAIDPRILLLPPPGVGEATQRMRARRLLDLVGLEVGEGADALLAVALPGSPSDRAGLRDGTVLLRIGERRVRRLAEARAALAAIGDREPLRLTVLGGGSRDRILVAEFPAPRGGWHAAAAGPAPPSSAGAQRSSRGVLHLRIVRFDAARTRPMIEAALVSRPVPTAVVIDLRHNGGGSLVEALSSAALFLPFGTSMGSLSPALEGLHQFTAREARPMQTIPLFVVIDRYTASAAEVFAAALQGTRRATLLGERTSGKCVAEQSFPLFPEDVVLVVPVARFIPPGGVTCSDQGLQPDRVLSTATMADTSLLLSAMPLQ